MTNKLKEEIIEKAHLYSAQTLARRYYNEAKIDFADLNHKDFEDLRDLIQKEISKLLVDQSNQVAPGLEMESKIKNNREGVFLTVCSDYFKNRQAISFCRFSIYFCSWADGYNQTPFILGFINWVDNLKSIKRGKND